MSAVEPRQEVVRTIRFDVVADDGDVNCPRVSIVVDGARIFEQFERGYRGLDPDKLFLPNVPLLPVDPPARVAPYSCSCGEAGCGCIAVLISARGAELVVWSDPRDFTGEFFNRASREYPDPETGSPLPISELIFERVQYENELARATADRRWETPGRAVARRLRTLMLDEADSLLPSGWQVGWTEHAFWLASDGLGPVYNIELHRWPGGSEAPRDSQLVISLRSRLGGISDPVLDMVHQLRSTPHGSWPSRFRRIRKGAGERSLQAFP